MFVLGAHKRYRDDTEEVKPSDEQFINASMGKWYEHTKNDMDFVNDLGNRYIVSNSDKSDAEFEKETNEENISQLLRRTKRAVGDSDTSGTDPGSSDISMNESDIPLTNLKPRQRQDIKALPKPRPNLRSKGTIWYRPVPTAEDFEMDEITTSTPKKAKTTVVADPQIPGPSRPLTESDLIYNKSASSSESSLNTPNKSTKPLMYPKAKVIPKGGPKIVPKVNTVRVGGAVAGAGSEYQDIFEGHLGAAAGDPSNPLAQWFHNQFYSKKPTINDHWQSHYNELLNFDRETADLRLSYHSSKSWYEREQIMKKLNKIRDTWRNKYDNEKYQQAFDQYWKTYEEHFKYSDNELREEIKQGMYYITHSIKGVKSTILLSVFV